MAALKQMSKEARDEAKDVACGEEALATGCGPRAPCLRGKFAPFLEPPGVARHASLARFLSAR